MEKIHTISVPDCHVSHVIIKVELTEKQMITLENTYFTRAEYIYLKTNWREMKKVEEDEEVRLTTFFDLTTRSDPPPHTPPIHLSHTHPIELDPFA